MKTKNKKREGQVMLLSILVIGSLMTVATALAGFLVIYQIKMSGNVMDSAKAIFASDAGIDQAIYQFTNPSVSPPLIDFSNGASFVATCYNTSMTVVDCTNPSVSTIRSFGSYGSARRTFELNFVNI